MSGGMSPGVVHVKFYRSVFRDDVHENSLPCLRYSSTVSEPLWRTVITGNSAASAAA